MRRRARAFLLAGVLIAPCTGAAGADPVQSGETEDGGVRIDWRYAPHAQEPGLGTLEIETRDALAGTPVDYGGGRLLAWLQQRRSALSDAETPCAARVRALAAPGLGQRADIDLNAYRLLTLNTDGSLAVINPFVALGNAKLEAIVDLGGTPADWVEMPDRMEVWVLLSQPPALVGVDMQAREVARRIELPQGSAPDRLVLDGGLLRVALPGIAALGTFDPAGAASIGIAASPPVLAVATPRTSKPGTGGLLVAGADGTVALLKGGEPARRWRVAGGPIAAAATSPLARRLIAATGGGVLHWLDPDAPEGAGPERSLALGHPVSRLLVLDGGRRLVAMGQGRASLVDLAAATVDLAFATPKDADQLAETDRFLYAVSTGAGHATLWSLADLRAGRDQPLDVVTGSPAPGASAPAGSGRAAVSPEGDGLLVANAADGTIYQYAEGMMAPTGSFRNYRRAALGLLVQDLSPRQTAAGHYRGTVRHAKGGVYDLLLGGVEPRFSACAVLRLEPLPGIADAPEAPVRVTLLSDPEPVEPLTFGLRFAVRRGNDGLAGLRDLTLLVFDRHGGWQKRVRLGELGPGEYGARVAVPEPGRYEVLLSSASQDISFLAGRVGDVAFGIPR